VQCRREGSEDELDRLVVVFVMRWEGSSTSVTEKKECLGESKDKENCAQVG
jgi:hypothetical protein